MTKIRNFQQQLFRLVTTAVIFFSLSAPALADQFDDQINALKAQANAQQAQVNELAGQANTLANKVAGLNAQIAAASAQLDLNQAKFDKLTTDLAEAEAKLVTKKAILDQNIKTIYLEGQVSPIEVLATSGSISEFFDRQHYLAKLKDSIQENIKAVVALKAQLEQDRKHQTELIAEGEIIRSGLQSQRNEVATLLAETEGQESVYQAQLASSNKQIAQLKAQQAAAIAAASHHISGGSGCGGYPAVWCNAPQDSMVDSWGMYNRECVSYTAWATAVRFGRHMPYWGGRGNANQWPANADAAGIPRDGNPRVGDVGIYMGGFYGHAVIVEQVKSSTVIVSNFNANNTGHYSVDEWPISSLTFIHFR